MKDFSISHITAAIAILLISVAGCVSASPQESGQGKDGDRSRGPRVWYRGNDPRDVDECRLNLHHIGDAIRAFERAHKRLPRWLSELVPDDLEPAYLVCPYVRRIADLKSWRYGVRYDVFDDPKESTSYTYEFCDKNLPLWTGFKRTWADYKRRQLEVVGNDVPIVRCFAHEPVLNLAFNGRIYSSPIDWESLYTKFEHEDLEPAALFFQEPPRADPSHFARRNPEEDPRLLDLTSFYNAYLDETWLPYPRDCDLGALPRGVQVLGGTRFDIRGLIQMGGGHLRAPYPVIVTGIKVRQTCGRIVFLHGTRTVYHADTTPYEVKDGTKIAACIVHFESGSQVEVPILYGSDVKDWFYDPLAPDHAPAKVAWAGGENVASSLMHRKIRLFQTSWKNPWTNRVDSLSLISAMADTAPFVVAITLE